MSFLIELSFMALSLNPSLIFLNKCYQNVQNETIKLRIIGKLKYLQLFDIE